MQFSLATNMQIFSAASLSAPMASLALLVQIRPTASPQILPKPRIAGVELGESACHT